MIYTFSRKFCASVASAIPLLRHKEMKTNMTYENDQVTEAMEVNFA
jgi:hypothetical protein